MAEVWKSGCFFALGTEDAHVAGVLEVLAARDYDGWVVVEQDILNGPDVPLDAFLLGRSGDQRISREFLRRWIPE